MQEHTISRLLRMLAGVALLVVLALAASSAYAQPPSDLFISEYIEGSSNHKALEIYNGTTAAIDLATSGYVVQMYFNGSSSAGLTISLNGSVAAGDVFVLAHSSADSTILAQADQTNGAGWFNGDDAVVLRKDGASGPIVDAIGQVGFDPGSEWGSDLTSTADNTLRRNATVCAGDTDPSDVFDPMGEWAGFAQNTFDGLGSHTTDCTAGTAPVVSITTTDASAAEAGQDPGAFQISRTGDTAEALTIAYTIDGSTASNDGSDYTPILDGMATVLAGAASVDITVTPVDDADDEGDETLTLTLSSGSDYTLGSQTSATVTIADDDTTEVACGAPATPIHDVQGSGPASPLAGTSVTIEGVVVGDFQEGDGDAFNTNLDGFYVQEEESDIDSDAATSEGIFVFAPGAVDVNAGDLVRVTGEVDEFFGLTELTQVSNITICASDNVPEPVPVTTVDTGEFEQYEGMLVTFPQALTISEYFNFDRFGEIVLTDERQFQPTAVAEPGSADASQIAASNARNRITLDDGRASQNPDPARHPDGDVFALDNRFRGGDAVRNLTGVLDYRFDLYRIQPTTGADYLVQNPRPAQPADVGGRLTVASFNVLNYFLTLDAGPDICGPAQNQECRGADTQEEFERQRAKILSALSAIEADVFGLIEMENTLGVEPLQDIVEGLNTTLGPDTYAFIDTGTIGTDAIRLGFIYNPDAVTPIGDYAVLDSSVDPRFIDTRNRPALAQTFQENATGEVLTVVVNHLKSKGSDCGGAPDDDPQQGNCNGTRTQAAEALVDWLATDPTGSGDPDFLIIGDLNAYDKEDPIDQIWEGADDAPGTEDDYVDLILQHEGELAYSYLFDGQLGYLDHALAIQSLAAQVTGATGWHINADEPDLLDYDTSFKQDAQDALYEPNPYRSSDHDPVIVGLALTTPAQPVVHLHYRYWRIDWVHGSSEATLFNDGTFVDGAGQSGTWYAFNGGRALLLAYPPDVACGALLVGTITSNLKYQGVFICQDDLRLWGAFQGQVDSLPPTLRAASVANAVVQQGMAFYTATSLCDLRHAVFRAWMEAEGAEPAPCHTVHLPGVMR